ADVLSKVLEVVPTEHQSDVLQEIADKVTREPERFAGLAESFARWADRKSISMDWAQAIKAYSVAISLDQKEGGYYVGRARAYLLSHLEKEAGRDLEEALNRDALIDKNIALDFVRWGDEESAKKAVLQSAKAFKDPDEQAGALENLGLYYIRTDQWQKAFDHT